LSAGTVINPGCKPVYVVNDDWLLELFVQFIDRLILVGETLVCDEIKLIEGNFIVAQFLQTTPQFSNRVLLDRKLVDAPFEPVPMKRVLESVNTAVFRSADRYE
jgi:hypothetical protein